MHAAQTKRMATTSSSSCNLCGVGVHLVRVRVRVNRRIGDWDIGALGQWDSWALGHWEIGALAHWRIGALGALGHWGIAALRHWGIGALGHTIYLDHAPNLTLALTLTMCTRERRTSGWSSGR